MFSRACGMRQGPPGRAATTQTTRAPAPDGRGAAAGRLSTAREDRVMAERILGPTGSTRRKRFLLVPLTLAALAAFFVIAGAQATPPEQNPPGYFELDKNLINNEQTP